MKLQAVWLSDVQRKVKIAPSCPLGKTVVTSKTVGQKSVLSRQQQLKIRNYISRPILVEAATGSSSVGTCDNFVLECCGSASLGPMNNRDIS